MTAFKHGPKPVVGLVGAIDLAPNSVGPGKRGFEAMDEAYRKHHMWVRPKMQGLPSDYYKAHGFASFQEDPSGLALMEEAGLEGCFMWANDYPHHEGTWPHSAEAIEEALSDAASEAPADPA